MIRRLSSGTKSTLRSSVTSQQVGNVNRLSSYQSSVGSEFVSLSSIFLFSAPPSSLSLFPFPLHAFLIFNSCDENIDKSRRRDWKCLYMYAEDACHGHIKVCKLHNFATLQRTTKIVFIALKDFVHCSRVARGPEAKKERIKHLFCRWTAVWPCGFSWDLQVV